ncbi:MAG TPA: DUF115 domain-containing protein [Spirochaetota bacterium]|nr:DUF115 domain-containing protein [Spirochaetota bacterium]
MDKTELFSTLNSGILAERGAAFRRNLEKNLPLIRKSGGLGPVIPMLKGRHVIIAGAGPSLDIHIPSLAGISGDSRFILVAADMALRPLVSRGITPDFVITCEATPADFFSGIDTSPMHLLAFSCSSFSSIRKWTGRISFYNWMLEGDFFNSLMLAGNDMGFRERFYALETSRFARSHLKSGRFSPAAGIEMSICRNNRCYEIVRDNRTFFTNHQFLAARYWLDELFGREPFPVADCSFPGCSPSIVYKTGLDEYINTVKVKSEERL